MTPGPTAREGGKKLSLVSLWRAARAELIIAGVTVTATAGAGYAMAGGAGAALVILVAAVVALVALRALVPAGTAPDDAAMPRRPRRAAEQNVAPSMSGYWRQRFAVAGGMARLNSYEAGLRRTLERLLAARLAERHGINLYEEPAAARRVLCGDGRDADLWFWVDPERPPDTAAGPRGIPRRTLGRLLDRLEQL